MDRLRDDVGATAIYRKLLPRITVVEGTSADAACIKELRTKECSYAKHVTSPRIATAAELVDQWRTPFENDLSGQLPGGYRPVLGFCRVGSCVDGLLLPGNK